MRCSELRHASRWLVPAPICLPPCNLRADYFAKHMTLRDDITAALASVPVVDFKFVRLDAFQDILDRIAEQFLTEGARDLRFVWLWERFRHQISSSRPEDALAELEKRLHADERYWFLASDEHGKYWVADASGAGIVATLREMYAFEYYVVDRRMNWLICENHHGVLIEAAPRQTSP